MKIETLNCRFNWSSSITDHLEMHLQVLFFYALLDYTVCEV